MNIFKKLDRNILHLLLTKYIRTKTDFEAVSNRITDFINIKEIKPADDGKIIETVPESWSDYMALIQREMISPCINDGINNVFLSGLSTNYEDPALLKSIVNLFLNGKLAEKKYLIIRDFNFSLYHGITKYNAYKNEDNIRDEIQRILRDIDPDGVFTSFVTDNYNQDIVSEFLTINNKFAEMFTNNHVTIYSALLNFSRNDFLRNPGLSDFLGLNEVPDNWNDLQDIFFKFLKEIDTRTIHY